MTYEKELRPYWKVSFHSESRARSAVNHIAEILTHNEDFKKVLSCFDIEHKERSEYRELKKGGADEHIYRYKSYDEGYIVNLYTSSKEGVDALIKCLEKHGREILHIHANTKTDLPLEISKMDLYFTKLKD